MLVLSTRLGAFLHEYIGHGLMADVLGGKFESFSLTLFAGGEAKFTGQFTLLSSLLISFGGIIINLVTGLISLILLQKVKYSFSLTLFGWYLASVSILSQLQYLILGAYYQHGDPACLSPYPLIKKVVWISGLLTLPIFTYLLMAFFFRFQNKYFHCRNFSQRAIYSLLILGVPLLIYLGLYSLSSIPLASTASIQEAQLYASQEAKRMISEGRSLKSLEELEKELMPPPLWPWILGLYFAATLPAFLFPKREEADKTSAPFPSSGAGIWSWVIIAGLTLLFLALLW